MWPGIKTGPAQVKGWSLLPELLENHEFTIAVITVIFAVYRDFWPLPSFRVTAVNIDALYAISVFNRSLNFTNLYR